MTTHFIREGYLQRVNANRLSGESAAICPYSRDGDNCGDWCALFHESGTAVKLECASVRIQLEEDPKEVEVKVKDKFNPNSYPDNPNVKEDFRYGLEEEALHGKQST